MDWDKTFDGKDILCDETNTYIKLYQDGGKWYAEYSISANNPYKMKARSLEEAKWRASMNFLNALNKQISKLVRIRSGIPNLKKLKKDANKVKMERKQETKDHTQSSELTIEQ